MRRVFGGIADAFEDRNFRNYSIGAIVSWLSFFVQAVAVSWTAWDLTHSTRWLALVALSDAAPNIVLMPIGGVLADRFDRFKVQQTAYALATLQAALLAGLAFAGALNIALLAALAFLHGTIHAFSIPAQYGLLPRFVEPRRLPSAIAVAAAYTQLGLFVGPALAGWVILHFGAAVAFASNVAGYGVYFLFAAKLRTPPAYRPPAPSGKSFRADLVDGFRAIAAHRGLRAMLTLMLCGDALASALRQMAPAFADKALGAGVQGLSALLASGGIGAALAALWLAHGGARRATPAMVIATFPAFLAAIGALMASRSLAPAAAAMMAVGCCFEICKTGSVSILQTSVPDALRGRVMSTQFLLLRLAGALGVGAIGAAAQDWGLRLPISICALLALAAWTIPFRARRRIARDFARRTGDTPPLEMTAQAEPANG